MWYFRKIRELLYIFYDVGYITCGPIEYMEVNTNFNP